MCKLFRVSLENFTGEQIPLPEPGYYSPNHAWAEGFVSGVPEERAFGADPLHRPSGSGPRKWEMRTPGVPWQRCFVAGDTVYLGLDGGLGRYDWEEGEFTLLASSRRRPAQNQFDDCGNYRVDGVYIGLGGRPFVVTSKRACYIQEGLGEWPQVVRPAYGMQGVAGEGVTLNYSRSGAAVLLDPSREAPEYLLSQRSTKCQAGFGKAPASLGRADAMGSMPGVDLNGNAAFDRQRLFPARRSRRAAKSSRNFPLRKGPRAAEKFFSDSIGRKACRRIDRYAEGSGGTISSQASSGSRTFIWRTIYFA